MGENASEFICLSPNVFLLESTTRSTDFPTTANPPDTIIVLAWMGAQFRHITKYTSAYSKLYPNARILLITASWADFTPWSNSSTSHRRLAPAIATLLANPDERLLVHLFSNAGSKQLNNLNAAFREATGRLLPIQALVLDSAPGRATFWRAVWTILLTLPRQRYLRVPLFVFSVLIVGTFWLVKQLTGAADMIEEMRQGLNDTQFMVPGTRRCYIYSDTDESIRAEDVEDHADDARRKGWIAGTEKFVGSAHVGHMRLNNDRYWRVVQELWERTCSDT